MNDSIAKGLARRWWTLQRFGLTPTKLVRRLTNRDEPKILCISIPKAGTHLLERALCLHPRLYRKLVRTVEDRNLNDSDYVGRLFDNLKPGQIIISHLHYSSERLEAVRRNDIKTIFMIRDPRDVAISEHNFIRRNRGHYLHELFAKQPDDISRLRLTILGDETSHYPPIAERLEHFKGWLTSACLVLRFEDLVGTRGGGLPSRQKKLLDDLFAFLGLSLNAAEMQTVSNGLFSELSPTFRKGQAGGWKQELSEEILELFRKEAGETLISYGYEESDTW